MQSLCAHPKYVVLVEGTFQHQVRERRITLMSITNHPQQESQDPNVDTVVKPKEDHPLPLLIENHTEATAAVMNKDQVDRHNANHTQQSMIMVKHQEMRRNTTDMTKVAAVMIIIDG